MAKYWYFITTYTCPVCGRWYTVRERKQNPKPTNPKDTCNEVQTYDGCEGY